VEKSYEEEFQDAVERKDLICLCTNYKAEDLIRIVTELIVNGAGVDDIDFDGDTALPHLCFNYTGVKT